MKLLQMLLASAYVDFKPTLKHKKKGLEKAREDHRLLCEAEGKRLARFLLDQWPSSDPSIEGFESSVIDPELALESIYPEWERLHRNMELSEYVNKVQQVLDRHKGPKDTSMPSPWTPERPEFYNAYRDSVIPSLSGDLLIKCGPAPSGFSYPSNKQSATKDPFPDSGSVKRQKGPSYQMIPSREVVELSHILHSFARSPDTLRQQYGNDLRKSLAALQDVSSQPKVQAIPSDFAVTVVNTDEAREAMNLQFDRIGKALSEDDCRFQWLQLGNMWPAVTPTTTLELLRSSSAYQFGYGMKEALISYGVVVTQFQRLDRIQHAQLKRDQRKVLEEWQNTGHENWIPLDFPDWLLLEIDSNLLIRREQIDVARTIISPASGSNSVLQMNMGKGKSLLHCR